MKPVEQRTDNDCLRACLASVFEISYEEVPEDVVTARNQNYAVSRYLETQGFGLWWFGIWGTEKPFLMFGGNKIAYSVRIPGHWIACVRSPRNEHLHAVVMHAEDIVWDPHPRRDMGHRGFAEALVITKL